MDWNTCGWLRDPEGDYVRRDFAERRQACRCDGLDRFERRHARGELGYWIGVDYWNLGYCTEAAAAVIRYARDAIGITKIVARCALENYASAGVMEKIGLKREGLLAKHALKHGRYDDILVYGLVLPGREP